MLCYESTTTLSLQKKTSVHMKWFGPKPTLPHYMIWLNIKVITFLQHSLAGQLFRGLMLSVLDIPPTLASAVSAVLQDQAQEHLPPDCHLVWKAFTLFLLLNLCLSILSCRSLPFFHIFTPPVSSCLLLFPSLFHLFLQQSLTVTSIVLSPPRLTV